MAVRVTNYSVQVKARMSQAVRNALYESGSEVASHANSNVQMQNDAGQRLRGSYTCYVNATGDRATVGTPLEEGLWEEYGTGSHADMARNGGIPGRPEWWVYVTNETPRAVQPVYLSEDEAKAIAAGLRETGKDAHASDGYDPSYTLEKAFTANRSRIERIFENDVRTGMS